MTFAHRIDVRRRLFLVPVAAVVLTATACGSSSGSSRGDMPGMTSTAAAAAASAASPGSYPPVMPGPAAVGAHNDTDVVFANDMIPHHGQAVQMADLILSRTTNARVKALAERIRAAQSPEITTMAGWLKGWGSAVPDPYAPMAEMGGMPHGGMMSAEQMSQLGKATGAAADKMFLTGMQGHHAGALEMAKGEVEGGSNPAAKKLARSIVTSQTKEIAEMKAMAATLG